MNNALPTVDILTRLSATLAERKNADPASSYSAKLLHQGVEALCKKIGEEAVETIMAAKDGDMAHTVREVADLWFHTLLLLTHQGASAKDVLLELARREGISGIDEKNARTKQT